MKGCRPLDEIEVRRAIDQCRAPRERALFILGIRSGLRIAELLSLKVSDVMQYGAILERIYIARKNLKGSREGRSIALHNDAREAIQALVIAEQLKSDFYLFKSRNGYNKALTTCQAWRIIKELFRRAEIPGHVATHTMRKTFADRVYSGTNQNIFQTQRALGHKSLNSTASYLSFDEKLLDDVIKGAK